MMERTMRKYGAREQDIADALELSRQFEKLRYEVMSYSQAAYKVGGGNYSHGVLEPRSEELLDLFGQLRSVDEVHKIIVKEWHLSVGLDTVRAFYSRHLKEIDRLRDQYSNDFGDLSLTKKRGRLDKLSQIFYTYYNKWYDDPRLDYSRELRAIIDQIKKEVEGEQLTLNVQGQINVDLTIEVNKTIFEAQKRVPVNNMILALVAAKRGIDPTRLMTQLTSSYYNSLTGYGRYEPEKQLVPPTDLTYNWNEIERRHRAGDKSLLMIEDAVIIESTGTLENDVKMNTLKNKLHELLDKDKAVNAKRKTK
jgi:hypothetical protein